MGDRSSSDREAIDREVLAHLDHGETREAVTFALNAYGARILGFLTAILRDERAAEEAYAQFTEDLVRGIEGFRRECAFRTWAYQLAHNAAYRWQHDPFRRRGQRLATSEAARLPASARDSTLAERRQRLHDLRARLDPEDQVLLVLKVDQDMSWRDVARVVSRPEAPVDEAALRKRYERLKERLRALARDAGLLEE